MGVLDNPAATATHACDKKSKKQADKHDQSPSLFVKSNEWNAECSQQNQCQNLPSTLTWGSAQSR